ncbi:VOC family protein [Streptomyces tsukubensis]|uniref:Doxorubicin biosynthesis protein DnrV n=1 Tax=Streptomyces tsukubensis TaxID=83656 RepID=A0A1V4A6S1_9ACTN|nr:VOC family protein [Streptomyces tsukubensis]OON77742.1 doxorubicin biosynthesis protein DnrV [Streptomyces tsukubensis]QFR93216.1 VOC family protein [Streptomyces tsukubensis]
MRISNAPSAPCWADLSTPEPAAAHRFYGALFGWETWVVPDPAAGGYGVFQLGGAAVGGVGPTAAEDRPAAWLPYFQSAGADAVTARVEGNGGTVTLGPEDVLEQGRMALCADPTGAAFGVWQPRERPGFGVANEPGSFCWFELAARDTARPKDFYAAVFGWASRSRPFGAGGSEYTEWTVSDQPFGGMAPMSGAFPPSVRAHWLVYVAVDDCDAAAARCARQGGDVLVPPTTVEPGRFSVLADPQGAVFAVLAFGALSDLGRGA